MKIYERYMTILVSENLNLRLASKCLITNYQPYVHKQKHSTAYMFLNKNMVTRPCPKKIPVTGLGVSQRA